MIPFQTWLSQIVGYCHFVADALGVQRAWRSGNYSQTSVTDFDELYEQIFDDLDSDSLEGQLATNLRDEPEAQELIRAFLQQVRVISDRRVNDPALRSTAVLIDSAEWGRLVEIARAVVRRSPFPGTTE